MTDAPERAPRITSKNAQAAFNHAAVSKALLIIGMLTPKFALAPVFAAPTFGAGLLTRLLLLWAVSVARSHDPDSWERATEKNRNT
jgi:hypothetical protein